MFDLLSIKGLRAASLLFLLAVLAQAMPAAAQVTSLSMTSDQGDYIGQGQTYLYTPTDGTFNASVGINNNNVSFFFNTPTFDHFWSLDFAAPNGAPLTPGTYLNATRHPFQATTVPGLSVSGDGRGCNTLTGSFQVLQAVYGPANTLVAFAYDEQGRLTLLGHVDSRGRTPRNFDIDPRGEFLIVANQEGNGGGTLAVFAIGADGRLAPRGEALMGLASPAAVAIVVF